MFLKVCGLAPPRISVKDFVSCRRESKLEGDDSKVLERPQDAELVCVILYQTGAAILYRIKSVRFDL